MATTRRGINWPVPIMNASVSWASTAAAISAT